MPQIYRIIPIQTVVWTQNLGTDITVKGHTGAIPSNERGCLWSKGWWCIFGHLASGHKTPVRTLGQFTLITCPHLKTCWAQLFLISVGLAMVEGGSFISTRNGAGCITCPIHTHTCTSMHTHVSLWSPLTYTLVPVTQWEQWWRPQAPHSLSVWWKVSLIKFSTAAASALDLIFWALALVYDLTPLSHPSILGSYRSRPIQGTVATLGLYYTISWKSHS